MTRQMIDSTDPAAVPDSAQLAAGYVNGRYESYGPLVSRLGELRVVGIDVLNNNPPNAVVLDVETGDATPADVPGWLDRQRAKVLRPTIYCPHALVGEVQAAAGGRRFDLWVADWTGAPHGVGLGEVAVQYADPGMIPGHPNIDLSVVFDDSWPYGGADQTTPPPPPTVVVAPGVAPPLFPLPPGHWYGTSSNDPRNHSGYYSPPDRAGIAEFQTHLRDRGWRITPDGFYGNDTRGVVQAFQREKGLTPDGLVGVITWGTIWTAAVT